MSNHIFVFLEIDLLLENASCLVVSSQGDLVEPYKRRDLEQLKVLCQDNELIIILPATVIAAHLVNLPTLKKSDLMIPNILEEELIGDIDETHFVLQSKIKVNDKYLVYTINKNVFEKFLSQLKDSNLSPSYITSELLCSMENNLLIADESLQIISQASIGSVPSYLVPTMELAGIEELNIMSFKNSSKELINFIKKHKFKINTKSDLFYQEFVAQELLKQPPLNILQGNYKPRQKHGLLKKLLGVPLLVLSLVFFVGANIRHYQQVKNELQILKNDNFKRYKKVFPNSSSMISPRFRIERLIKNGSANEQQLFISIMSKAAPILNEQNKISVLNLAFQNSQLNITFTMPSFNALEKLQQELEAKSITVNQVSATTKKDLVNALWRLSI